MSEAVFDLSVGLICAGWSVVGGGLGLVELKSGEFVLKCM